MTDLQEALKITKAQEKFYRYLISDKNELLAKETAKLEAAQEKFKEMLHKLENAPEKLSEATIRAKQLEKNVKTEQAAKRPISRRKEINDLVEQMKKLLGE